MKCILAATDGSKGAERAVEIAATLARTNDADLWIVNVPVAKPRISTDEVAAYARSEHLTPNEVLALAPEDTLARGEAIAATTGVRNVRTETESGDPAQAIMESARDKHADLIVVGRRGRGRLAGLMMGSVSQKVAASAPCAVLVVP